jgi:hypothetical protein
VVAKSVVRDFIFLIQELQIFAEYPSKIVLLEQANSAALVPIFVYNRQIDQSLPHAIVLDEHPIDRFSVLFEAILDSIDLIK